MEARLRVLALVTNIPGPLTAAALAREGADVRKIEPPEGDPLAAAAAPWYAAITASLRVERMDLKTTPARGRLDTLLGESDLLITAMRGSALARLGLDWKRLHEMHPRLCHVAIVGENAPNDDYAGHDLTYQAQAGLIDPPAMPRSVYADLFAAQAALAASYRLLFERERSGAGARAEIGIANCAAQLTDPLRYGLTAKSGPLGGALPVYGLYETADGWVALAALEPHFRTRVREALDIETLERAALCARFAERPCAYWEQLARQYDLPLCAVVNI